MAKTTMQSSLDETLEKKNKHYLDHILQWQKNRLICSTAAKVKERSELFVPKLRNQTPEDYRSMVQRGNFFAGAARAIQGINGTIHSKTPARSLSAPATRTSQILDHIGPADSSINDVAEVLTEEQLLQGWVGCLANFEIGPDNNFIYSLTILKAEDIYDWNYEKVNGVRRLNFLKYASEESFLNPETMTRTAKKVIFVLYLDEAGFYFYKKYSKLLGSDIGNDSYVLEKSGAYLKRGIPIKGIPARLLGARKVGVECPEEAPMTAIVDVNISHFQTSIDLEMCRHYTAFPTPYICSDELGDDLTLSLGGDSIWKIPQSEAKVGMLEYTGQGLQSLENADEGKIWQMAVLGARMLMNDKKANESSQTVKLRQNGENSIATTVARICSSSLTYLLSNYIADWDGLDSSKVSFTLNTDFLTIEISSDMMNSLLSAVATNKLSFKTFFYNLRRGGLYPQDTTSEDEQSEIQKDLESDPSFTSNSSVSLTDEEPQDSDNAEDE